MKKLILLLFILPIFCFAQTNVTPQWKKFPVFDSLGYSITGSTGNHWLYDAHFIRVNYLTKSGFTDSLNAHKVYFTNNFQKIGDTVDLANSVSITGTMTANSGMLIGGVTDTAGHSFSENRLINGVLVREGFGSTKFQGGGAAMATFYGTSQSHALAVPALMSTPFFSSDSSRTWHRIPVIDNYVGATLDTVTHTLTVTGSGGVPNPLTNGWGINTFSFDGSSAGVQVQSDTSAGKLATQYYTSTVVGADGILTGLVTTTVTTTATTTAGTYRLNNALIVKSTSTNTTIPAQDATLNRYTLIVGDASGVFTAVNGTLAADAVEPDIPANKALIASIYIPAVGGTVTTTGGGSGKGTVIKVSSSTTDILVANQTTTPILTLNKVNGFPITYYDATSSIQTQLNGKQATLVSGTNIKTVNGSSILGSGNLVVGSSVTPVSGETPTGTINGTNPTFTIAHTPISGSVSVFINGLMERPTTDWTISGTTLTMIDIPATGDNLMVNYQY